MYMSCGFIVQHMFMDGQFQHMENQITGLGITLNICSRKEHVSEIERNIRTVKERVRGVYNTLPFKKMPRRLIIELVKCCIFWLNAIHPSPSIAPNMSPRTILTGKTINYNTHCVHEFGFYVQTHEEHDNSMRIRTIGALALRPTGNVQGGHFFLSLVTGWVLNRQAINPLPMPDSVIDRVHYLARRNPLGLTFFDRNVLPVPESPATPIDHEPTELDDPNYYTILPDNGPNPADQSVNIDKNDPQHPAGVYHDNNTTATTQIQNELDELIKDESITDDGDENNDNTPVPTVPEPTATIPGNNAIPAVPRVLNNIHPEPPTNDDEANDDEADTSSNDSKNFKNDMEPIPLDPNQDKPDHENTTEPITDQVQRLKFHMENTYGTRIRENMRPCRAQAIV